MKAHNKKNTELNNPLESTRYLSIASSFGNNKLNISNISNASTTNTVTNKINNLTNACSNNEISKAVQIIKSSHKIKQKVEHAIQKINNNFLCLLDKIIKDKKETRIDTTNIKKRLLQEIQEEKTLDDEYKKAKKLKQESIDKIHKQLKEASMSSQSRNQAVNQAKKTPQTNHPAKTNNNLTSSKLNTANWVYSSNIPRQSSFNNGLPTNNTQISNNQHKQANGTQPGPMFSEEINLFLKDVEQNGTKKGYTNSDKTKRSRNGQIPLRNALEADKTLATFGITGQHEPIMTFPTNTQSLSQPQQLYNNIPVNTQETNPFEIAIQVMEADSATAGKNQKDFENSLLSANGDELIQLNDSIASSNLNSSTQSSQSKKRVRIGEISHNAGREFPRAPPQDKQGPLNASAFFINPNNSTFATPLTLHNQHNSNTQQYNNTRTVNAYNQPRDIHRQQINIQHSATEAIKFNIVITLTEETKDRCNINLCKELLRCKPNADLNYEAKYLNNKTILVTVHKKEHINTWLTGWPNDAFHSTLENAQLQNNSRLLAAINLEKRLSPDEVNWLVHRYNIAEITQKRNGLHQITFNDESIYKKVMDDGFIFIVRCKVRIKEWSYMSRPTQCTNCQQFGHKLEVCTNKTNCLYCSGPHNSENCEHKEDPKFFRCINCIKTGDQNHRADDRNCARYKSENERINGKRTEKPTTNDTKTQSNDNIIKISEKQKQIERNMARTIILVQDVVDAIRIEDGDMGFNKNMNLLTDDMFNSTFTETIYNTHKEISNRQLVRIQTINNQQQTNIMNNNDQGMLDNANNAPLPTNSSAQPEQQ